MLKVGSWRRKDGSWKGMKDLISKRNTKCQRLNAKNTQLADDDATRITGAAERLSCAQMLGNCSGMSTPAILRVLCPSPSYDARSGSRFDTVSRFLASLTIAKVSILSAQPKTDLGLHDCVLSCPFCSASLDAKLIHFALASILRS